MGIEVFVPYLLQMILKFKGPRMRQLLAVSGSVEVLQNLSFVVF